MDDGSSVIIKYDSMRITAPRSYKLNTQKPNSRVWFFPQVTQATT